MALPGTYNVTMYKVVNGVSTELVGPQSFEIKPLLHQTLPAESREDVLAFEKESGELYRNVSAAMRTIQDLEKPIEVYQGRSTNYTICFSRYVNRSEICRTGD